VLTNFRERHKDDQVRLRALEELDGNPFGARLNIIAKDPTQYQGVADFLGDRNTSLSGDQVIDNVNFNENKEAIDRLSIIITSTERLGFFLGILLVIISVIITFNTIRLTIYVSREEIGVMRLVGASVAYIRGPFVFTGIMYGLVSGLLTLGIFYGLALWLSGPSERLFGDFNVFQYYTSNFGQIFLVVVGSGIIMGAISSYLAVMRYLKS
jgi:cell division transport system permease protein